MSRKLLASTVGIILALGAINTVVPLQPYVSQLTDKIEYPKFRPNISITREFNQFETQSFENGFLKRGFVYHITSKDTQPFTITGLMINNGFGNCYAGITEGAELIVASSRTISLKGIPFVTTPNDKQTCDLPDMKGLDFVLKRVKRYDRTINMCVHYNAPMGYGDRSTFQAPPCADEIFSIEVQTDRGSAFFNFE